MYEHKWTILIATVGARNVKFKQLYENLFSQVEALKGGVDVLIYWDNFESTLGKVRQALLESATGRYINFIDDDDRIPKYYCNKVYERLDGNVDYIGWRMQLYIDGVQQKPTFHSLRYQEWSEDNKGYYRNVSHLNPIKKELALKGRFDITVPEDHSWAVQVAPHVKTESYIDDIMYYYMHSIEGSLWARRNLDLSKRYVRPYLNSPYFNYHPLSSI